jgi:uncharacterized membrane protein
MRGPTEVKEWFVLLSEQAITLVDAIALLVIVYGSLETFVRALPLAFTLTTGHTLREVWLRYARWLVAGITFQLAADLIETSITTDWQTIARVGAVAVIRTFLDRYLDHDVAEIRARQAEIATATSMGPAMTKPD